MAFFHFSENNSGGSWWLSENDYRALFATGKWGVETDALNRMGSSTSLKRIEFLLRHDTVGVFDTYEAARESFESATGQNLDAEGCECCGSPFSLYESGGKTEVTFPNIQNALPEMFAILPESDDEE